MDTNLVTTTVTEGPRSYTAGQRIRDLGVGKSIAIDKLPMGGSLEARRLPSGSVQFYWRHTQSRQTERVAIGLYVDAQSELSRVTHLDLTRNLRALAVL